MIIRIARRSKADPGLPIVEVRERRSTPARRKALREHAELMEHVRRGDETAIMNFHLAETRAREERKAARRIRHEVLRRIAQNKALDAVEKELTGSRARGRVILDKARRDPEYAKKLDRWLDERIAEAKAEEAEQARRERHKDVGGNLRPRALQVFEIDFSKSKRFDPDLVVTTQLEATRLFQNSGRKRRR